MSYTAADLARILQQPDYAIERGSLVAGQNKKRSPGVTLWRNEREFQKACVSEYAGWAVLNGEDAILCHIANENAHRQPGVVGGMPDLCLCAMRGVYGALYVELKVGAGKVSAKQRDVHQRLRRAGYKVVVIWDSVEEVMSEIERYLKG